MFVRGTIVNVVSAGAGWLSSLIRSHYHLQHLFHRLEDVKGLSVVGHVSWEELVETDDNPVLETR